VGIIEQVRAARPAESRVIGGVPWRPWDSPFWKFSQGGPIHPTRAFYGKDEALGLPCLYACVRMLADSLASLPVKIYTRSPAGDRRAVRYNGPSIFDQPSVTGTTYDWLHVMMTSLLLQGNAWGFITGRDGYGFPTGIEWIPPEDVNVIDDEMQPWNPLRARIYVYGRLMSRDELFHIKAFSVAGRTEGISPLRAFAMTVLSGIETQRYGTSWYQTGGFPVGHFKNSEIEIDAEQAEAIRSMLADTLRRRQPLVYGKDWDYTAISVPPSEAQFVEAMRMNATLVASVYGLPPDRVGGTRGDSLTYNTVEQSTLQVIDALRPWMVRLEHAFFSLLPANRYVRLDSDALLKTDLRTRTDIYQVQRNIGLRTIDELRDLEDLEPLPDGVGNESIPLEVIVAMGRTTRGIPKSLMPQIVLEMDLAVERLSKLQQSGLAAPNVPPEVISPGAMLGRIVGQQRSAGDQEREDADTILDFLSANPDRMGQLVSLARKWGSQEEPEYMGAWVPSPRDLVLNGNGHSNGHGR
jgi:HK97 family phage portal protein